MTAPTAESADATAVAPETAASATPAEAAPPPADDAVAIELARRRARAAKFGLPLAEVQAPSVSAPRSQKDTALAKPASGKASAAAGTNGTAKSADKTAPPAPPSFDEETLKRRREKFGAVEKDEPQAKKRGKAGVAAAAVEAAPATEAKEGKAIGAKKAVAEEDKPVDPCVSPREQRPHLLADRARLLPPFRELQKKLAEEEERKRKRAERFGAPTTAAAAPAAEAKEVGRSELDDGAHSRLIDHCCGLCQSSAA